MSKRPLSEQLCTLMLTVSARCPNLVEVRVEDPAEGAPESMWVMLLSINPGAPLGGSITEYFLGGFNGTHFEAIDSTTRLTDFAKDNYAGQFFYGVPSFDDQISMNWASNWQYTNAVPSAGKELGDGFRSMMTVPRGHYIKNLTRFGPSLISYPYNMMSIVESELASNSSLGNGTVLIDYSTVQSGALYFEANITGLTTSDSLDGSLNFTFLSSASGEAVSGGTFLSSGDVWLDRGRTNGFQSPYFNEKFSATGLYNPADGAWRLSGLIDRGIIEIFLNGGELSATSVLFPTQALDTMILRVAGINSTATASVGVWALKATWLGQADVNGTVYGNVTDGSNSTMKRDMLGAMKIF
ncbi:hypothetical protein J1614_000631 [Plenodomus biglobosus]|nr:hypothetical protein J1614_000631 [Plenodomus biglobosus]